MSLKSHQAESKKRTSDASTTGQKDSRNNDCDNPSGCPLIVGIGAPADSLNAFRTFFSHMPDDSGLAFVLVPHVSPEHKNMLAELLPGSTDMPVTTASDGIQPEANHVYVLPPDALLTISDGRLHVKKPATPHEQCHPIDMFFMSLAADQSDNAISVVLAGAGSDGSQGLRAIKENGGLTLAQTEADGLVDVVLPVQHMPRRLLTYRQQMHQARSHMDPDGVRPDVSTQLDTLCAMLHAHTGHDVSHYKEKALARRIQRRMLVTQSDQASDYIDYLRNHPHEHDLLFDEFLFGATSFFRDPEAFEALKAEAFPAMLADKNPTDVVRVWVPGCATGEEAYSIAIALCEVMDSPQAPKVQIFATDINDRALDVARSGCFQAPLQGVSDARRERWFTQDQDEYRVVKQIREMCIFSSHSLIKDPPFSRMNLVSCRNLLIDLDADLQDHLVQSFHYALQPGGFLLLGASEQLPGDTHLFTEADKTQRLYIRSEKHPTHPRHVAASPFRPPERHSPARTPSDSDDSMDEKARQALENWSPAYVVIDESHKIVLFSGNTGFYLEPSSGAASLNLFHMLGKSLRGIVRTAVLQAFATGQQILRDDIMFTHHDRTRPLRLIVKMLDGQDNAVRHCVVAFIPLDVAPTPVQTETTGQSADEQPRIRALEEELRATRAQLHAAIELHENVDEELESANEEYQSVNEALQSSNEKLEVSIEEMQSINEELQAFNTELDSKNKALTQANDDIRDLLESTHIAALFLDSHLRIRHYTPAMTELFHLRHGDKGRPITDISPLVDYPQLADDVECVLSELGVTERLLRCLDSKPTYLLRMRPYLNADDVVDGVVLTFVDVTENQRQNTEHARLAAIVNSSRDAIFSFSLDDRIISWNPAAEHIFGLSASQVNGQPLKILLPDDAPPEAKEFFHSQERAHRLREFEMLWTRPDGQSIPLEINYAPVRNSEGNMIAGKISARDITKRHQSERHTEMMLGELSHRVKNTLTSVQAIALQTLASTRNLPEFRKAFVERLLALSNTHNLLASEAWQGAKLADIINSELAPYQRDDQPCVELEGEELKLDAKTALSLAMGIHELATNAGKYGALSVNDGLVKVTWEIRLRNSHIWLHMVWTEEGGPIVEKPTHQGFGTRLITDGIVYELGGEVKLDYPSTGVTCIFDVPLCTTGEQP